jgi:hypothetical protein
MEAEMRSARGTGLPAKRARGGPSLHSLRATRKPQLPPRPPPHVAQRRPTTNQRANISKLQAQKRKLRTEGNTSNVAGKNPGVSPSNSMGIGGDPGTGATSTLRARTDDTGGNDRWLPA